MNIPVTFLQQDGSDHFAVPVNVVSVAPIAVLEAMPAEPISLSGLVRSGLAALSVQLPHRRFRRRQRARLRLAIS
jgi:hypothetical protein